MKLSIIGGALLMLAGGCYPYYAEYDHEYVPDGPVIGEEPPAPLVEELPPEPFVGAIWVDGYWLWSGHRYVWVRGRYLRPPRPGVVWFHGGYVRTRGGYVYVSGRWAPPSYRMRYHYVHGPRWHRHTWYRRHYGPRGAYRGPYRGGHYRPYRGGHYRPGPRGGYARPPRHNRAGPPGSYGNPGKRHYKAPAKGGPGPHRAPPAGGGGRGGKHRAPRSN